MGQRIRSTFYPEKKSKKNKSYRIIIRLILLLILFNLTIGIAFFIYVFGDELKMTFSKWGIIVKKEERAVTKLMKTNSTHFNFSHVPHMYAGHSYHPDSMESTFNRKLHDYYFGQVDSLQETHLGKKVRPHYGIDVSHWQNSINWAQVHLDTIPHKLKFFIIKATQGESSADLYFKHNWANAKTEHTYTGAYHFYIYSDDPILQAENYIRNVQLKKGDIMPIVDIEIDCAGCTEPGLPEDELIKNLKIYIKTIEDHFGVKPILYTYTYFYNTYLRGHFDSHTFWISKFSTTPPMGLNINGDNTKGSYPTVAIWQFSSSERINGIIGNVDMSYVPVNYLDSVLIN